MRQIILIAHNLRSSHNVGSLLRTAEGLGVQTVFLSGYTPYPIPQHTPDTRLPHIARKVDSQIHKTALGAEKSVPWQHSSTIDPVLQQLRNDGYVIAALEQAPHAIHLPSYKPPTHIALIVGREVEGIESEVVQAADTIIEIPMDGQKESFNVVQAAAMALYHCRFHPFA